MADKHQDQIERNYQEFLKKLPELMKTDAGKFALMRDGGIIGLFEGMADAAIAGSKMYPDGLFSIQEVINTPINLGYFSYAMP